MRRQKARKFRIIIKRALATAASLPILLFPAATGALSAGSDTTVNCDTNAVMYCGALSSDNLIHKYDNGDGKNSAQSIQSIYSFSKFNISSSDIHALSTNAVPGMVTKDGVVKVNGDVSANGQTVFHGGDTVATGAVTAGRQPLQGGTKEVSGDGTTFYVRSTSVSFTKSSLDAYVVMHNGVFRFAILSSCGNPITATAQKAAPIQQPQPQPQTHPNYAINKLVAPQGATNFGKSLSNLAPGTHITYQVTVQSTGDAAVQGLVVNDTLPSGVQYVDNSLRRDAVAVADPQDNAYFTANGLPVGTLAAGTSTVLTYDAIVAPNDSAQHCNNQSFTNTSQITATSLPAMTSSAVVSESCAPVPAVTTAVVTTPPQALPSTGPGTIAVAAFGTAAAVGTAGYYLFQRRRLS